MEQDFKEGLVVDTNDYSNGISIKRKDYNFKPYKKIDDDDRVAIYEKYYENQIQQFESYLDFINKIMCVLKHYRIVTEKTNFSARVKSIDSALENDQKKALNDIFGIGINAGISGESELLYLLFSSSLTPTRNVVKNKENGYAAHHFSGFPKYSNLSERLKYILSTKFNAEEMYKQYLDSIPDSEKKKIKLDDEEEQKFLKEQDNSNQEVVEEKQDKEEQEEQEEQEEKQDIKAYFIQYYNDLNKYIEKKKIIIKGARLKELEKEIKAIETEYYKTQKLKGKDNIYQPIIEVQFKTIAVYEEATNGTADHGDYKGLEIEEIQKAYDLKGHLPRSSLPAKMYKSNCEENEYGEPKPVVKITDPDEKAATMYPFLVINRKQRDNSDSEQEL